MTTKSYELKFGGYWREVNEDGIPAKSGIYGVYAATYNSTEKTVSLRKLLYIGESENVRKRIKEHEKRPRWRRELRPGEILCFNMAPISPAADRERAEAAMIFEHKPLCNVEYVNSFPFDTTTITTSGCNALMKARFTVHRTGSQGAAATYLGAGIRRL